VLPVPLRFLLAYDPLFLDLARRLRSGFLGKLDGSLVQAALDAPGSIPQVCAFILFLLGFPRDLRASFDGASSLGRFFFIYDGFVLSLEASVVRSGVPAPGIALVGSLHGGKGLLEFRFGAERLSAYSPREGESFRLAFPEGDGERYRSADLSRSGGPIVVDERTDRAAMEYVSSRLGAFSEAFAETRR